MIIILLEILELREFCDLTWYWSSNHEWLWMVRGLCSKGLLKGLFYHYTKMQLARVTKYRNTNAQSTEIRMHNFPKYKDTNSYLNSCLAQSRSLGQVLPDIANKVSSRKHWFGNFGKYTPGIVPLKVSSLWAPQNGAHRRAVFRDFQLTPDFEHSSQAVAISCSLW